MKAAPEFSIRRATRQDVKAILRCLRTAFAPYQKSYTAEGFLDTVLTPETLQERLKEMAIFVAATRAGEEIIGTIGCNLLSPEEGHLRGMAVLPEWQGHGVARQLLQAAELELQLQGCSYITLDTTSPLERAMSFYRRNGYRSTGEVKDFFGMPLFEYLKKLPG